MECRRPHRVPAERGMALIAVIGVLVALALIATPFLVRMLGIARRAEVRLSSELVDQEARSVLAAANLWLMTSPEELEVPRKLLDTFNTNSSRDRIWDLRVEDEQAKLNVRTAPVAVLGNLFGGSVLEEDLDAEAGRLVVADGTPFPEDGGLVRVGAELVRYEERRENVLSGLTRGVNRDDPYCAEPSYRKAGTLVVDAAAFEVATWPIRRREGELTEFHHPKEIRRVADLGAAALDPDDSARAARILTCWSGRVPAGGWHNRQRLIRSLEKGNGGEVGHEMLVENPRYFGSGTIVRIGDGTRTDYAYVEENDGRTIRLVGKLRYDWEKDRAWVEARARHPVNVNRASEDVLVAVLRGVTLRGRKTGVTTDKARGLAAMLREVPVTNLFDYRKILEKAVDERVIDGPDAKALYLNALHPGDAWLAVGTVPFCFESGGTYTVTATAVLCSNVGEELARRSIRRVVSVAPHETVEWKLESQEDFEAHVVAGRDAKWMMTWPYNTGGQFEEGNNPPSRYVAHVTRNIWPSAQTGDSVGDVRLVPERLDLDRVFHYDESYYPGGYYLSEGPLAYSVRDRLVGLVADEGVRPSGVTFWYDPYWGGRGNDRYFVDTGTADFHNRVAVFWDASASEVVFRVADATLEPRATEIRWKIDEPAPLEDDTWQHVGLSAVGSKPSDLCLLVDGRNVGRPNVLTRLTEGLGPGRTWYRWMEEEKEEIEVEDASGFPPSGAVVIRGETGPEIVEYDGRTDTSLAVRSRAARVPMWPTGFLGYEHEVDETVELLGYSCPAATDILTGGGRLATRLSKYHTLMVTYGEDEILLPPVTDEATGRVVHSGAPIRGIGAGRDWVYLTLGRDLMAWHPEITDREAFDAFNRKGYAVLYSVGPYDSLVPGETIGGWEIVFYRKADQGLVIERYRETKQIAAAEPHFVPAHCFRDETSPIGLQSEFVEFDGTFTVLLPISVEIGRNAREYYDVTEDDFLEGAYAQIDDEWIAYTYPETLSGGEGTVLVWDNPHWLGNLDNGYGKLYRMVRHDAGEDAGADDDGGGAPDDPGDGEPPPAEPPGGPPDDGDPGDGGAVGDEPGVGEPGGDDGDTGVGDDPGADRQPPDDLGPMPGPAEPPVEPPPPGGEPTPPSDGGDDGPDGGATPPPAEPPAPAGGDGGAEDGGPGDDLPPFEPPLPDPVEEEDGGPDERGETPPEPPLPPEGGGEEDAGPDGTETPLPDPEAGPAEPEDAPPAGDGESEEGVGDAPPPAGEPPVRPPSDAPSGPADPPEVGERTPGDSTGPGNGDPTSTGGGQRDRPGANRPSVPFEAELNVGHRSWYHMDEVVAGAGFRSPAYDWALANSVPEEHPAGADVIPAFIVVAHEGLNPGWDDRITVANRDGAVEELRINHHYYEPLGDSYGDYAFVTEGGYGAALAWIAPTSFPSGGQTVERSRRDAILAGTVEKTEVVRVLKFPSGELPLELGNEVNLGGRYDGSGYSESVVDELYFRADVAEEIARLGRGEDAVGQWFDGDFSKTWDWRSENLDPVTEEIPIHMTTTSGNRRGLPVYGFSEDGGVVRIDEELIVYRKLDTGTGILSGCVRGALGTDAQVHSFGARVSSVPTVTVAFLDGDLSAGGGDIPLSRTEGFPEHGGWVRIEDEIIGYSKIVDGSLVVPSALRPANDERTRRLERKSADEAPPAPPGGETGGDDSGVLLRGRFGTEPVAHATDRPVFLFPARYPDRYVSGSCDPETSAAVFRKRIDGAVWKRITWDEMAPERTDVKVLVRFDGRPEWDSPRRYDVGSDGLEGGSRKEFRRDPTSFVFVVDGPHAANELNVAADLVEVRVAFEYQHGAYDPEAEPPSPSWKDTPRFENLRLDYVASCLVHYTEDLR